MGKRIDIKNLAKNPDYQDFIQNRRPAQQARAEALRAEFEQKASFSEKRHLYGKSLVQLDRHSNTKLDPDEVVFDVPDRQQVLDLRRALEGISKPEDAVKVFDKIIFGDEPGDRTIVDTEPTIEGHRHIY